MEKVNFQNSKGLNLIGVLHIPKKETKSAIIISHGFAANKDRVRLINTANVFCKGGFLVLRFDFGGCGESDERPITVEDQVDDLKSAINFLRDKDYEKIGLLGESLGALSSILACDRDIKTMVLWAPVTKAKTPKRLKENKIQLELKKKGFIFIEKDERKFKIPKQYLIERESLNQQKILSKIKCPVLIIHGTKDDTVPLNESKEALQFLSEESRLEVIDGGDHKLEGDLNKVIFLSLNWFKKYLL